MIKLHLICHGLMLFWYKKQGNGQTDGYKIVIPKAYKDHVPLHDVRFGVGAGVPNPHRLLTLTNPEPEGEAGEMKSYKLTFGAEPNDLQRGGSPDKKQFLSFYERGDHQPVLNPAGIAYEIHVPYPHSQAPMRGATYENDDPYETPTGSAADLLDIRPHRIIGARVLTFFIKNPATPIKLEEEITGDISTVVRAPLSGDVKLHLYSQPPRWPTHGEDHTRFLNGMIKLKHKTTNVESDLNLTLNTQRKCTLDPDTIGAVGDLTFLDHLHLFEYNALYRPLPEKTDGSHGSRGEYAPFHYVDPAECGGGGGC